MTNNTLYVLKHTSGALVSVVDYDNRGNLSDRAGWIRKKELINYLRSFGYTVRRNGEVIGLGKNISIHKVVVR